MVIPSTSAEPGCQTSSPLPEGPPSEASEAVVRDASQLETTGGCASDGIQAGSDIISASDVMERAALHPEVTSIQTGSDITLATISSSDVKEVAGPGVGSLDNTGCVKNGIQGDTNNTQATISTPDVKEHAPLDVGNLETTGCGTNGSQGDTQASDVKELAVLGQGAALMETTGCAINSIKVDSSDNTMATTIAASDVTERAAQLQTTGCAMNGSQGDTGSSTLGITSASDVKDLATPDVAKPGASGCVISDNQGDTGNALSIISSDIKKPVTKELVTLARNVATGCVSNESSDNKPSPITTTTSSYIKKPEVLGRIRAHLEVHGKRMMLTDPLLICCSELKELEEFANALEERRLREEQRLKDQRDQHLLESYITERECFLERQRLEESCKSSEETLIESMKSTGKGRQQVLREIRSTDARARILTLKRVKKVLRVFSGSKTKSQTMGTDNGPRILVGSEEKSHTNGPAKGSTWMKDQQHFDMGAENLAAESVDDAQRSLDGPSTSSTLENQQHADMERKNAAAECMENILGILDGQNAAAECMENILKFFDQRDTDTGPKGILRKSRIVTNHKRSVRFDVLNQMKSLMWREIAEEEDMQQDDDEETPIFGIKTESDVKKRRRVRFDPENLVMSRMWRGLDHLLEEEKEEKEEKIEIGNIRRRRRRWYHFLTLGCCSPSRTLD